MTLIIIVGFFGAHEHETCNNYKRRHKYIVLLVATTCALILFQTLALYKSFTYLLTYLLLDLLVGYGLYLYTVGLLFFPHQVPFLASQYFSV